MIVLFDEIDKAHSVILRALMNVMDTGKISKASNSGGQREIDCCDAIFIFTSNKASAEILAEIKTRRGNGNQQAMADEICRRRLKAGGMPPEIIGRITRFLVYQPLARQDKIEIISDMVKDIAEEYGLRITGIAPETIAAILLQTESCPQPDSFGMRTERYIIDDLLGGPFAEAALKHSPQEYFNVTVSGPPFEVVPETPILNKPENSRLNTLKPSSVKRFSLKK